MRRLPLGTRRGHSRCRMRGKTRVTTIQIVVMMLSAALIAAKSVPSLVDPVVQCDRIEIHTSTSVGAGKHARDREGLVDAVTLRRDQLVTNEHTDHRGDYA